MGPHGVTRSRLASKSPDRHDLYELCAQNPPRDARLIHAIWADGLRRVPSKPVLAEDFCGTAALSAAWCEAFPNGSAIAVDIDPPTIAAAKSRGRSHAQLHLLRTDVLKVTKAADVIAVLNFSICEWHTRQQLVTYLTHARRRLSRGGAIICDLYGGPDAFLPSVTTQSVPLPRPPHPSADRFAALPRGTRIRYTWEQREADPFSSRVINAMHFEIRAPQSRPHILQNAFVYDWRLWSVAELQDAMLDAGFKRVQVYPRTIGAMDSEGNYYTRPIEAPEEALTDSRSFNVFVVGRV